MQRTIRQQTGIFDADNQLAELSAKGGDLEQKNALDDFEMYRPDLERAVPRKDRSF